MTSKLMLGKDIAVSDVTYRLTKKLGNGGFGYVFLAKVTPHPHCARQLPAEVAVKIEHSSKLSRPQLEYEKRVYHTILRKIRKENMVRIPMIYNFVEESPLPSYKALVMERMSYNLMELFESYQKDVDNGTREKPCAGRVFGLFPGLDCFSHPRVRVCAPRYQTRKFLRAGRRQQYPLHCGFRTL